MTADREKVVDQKKVDQSKVICKDSQIRSWQHYLKVVFPKTAYKFSKQIFQCLINSKQLLSVVFHNTVDPQYVEVIGTTD